MLAELESPKGRSVPYETLADHVSRESYNRPRDRTGVNVLVNSCVTRLPWPFEAAVSKPNQSLIKLESLILAQNERWRQA